MKCPFCGNPDTQVKDSRPSDDGAAIRRRRSCPQCNGRFTTFERVQLREVTVVKSGGLREPFDRDKLLKSVTIACRKRPIDPARIDRLVSAIQRDLETQGDAEVSTGEIGSRVMSALMTLDSVSYIRFASVYKDFDKASDFEEFAASIREVGGE